MICEYLQENGVCLVARIAVGLKIKPNETLCRKCAPGDFERATEILRENYPNSGRANKTKEPVSADEQNRRWAICETECQDEKCLKCHSRLRHKIRYGDCEKFN